MKGVLLLLFAGVTLASAAREFTLPIDTTGFHRESLPYGVPFVGYSADPKAADDDASVAACRRAGAWFFRTTLCDDATLRFCNKYAMKLFVVLDGDKESNLAALRRLAESPDKAAIAGFQLGTDPKGGADPTVWKAQVAVAARLFPKALVALPVNDIASPLYEKMQGGFAPVTHFIVDLRDAPVPYERIDRLARQIKDLSDKAAAKIRLLAVGPGRLAGMADAEAAAPKALAWQMHWIMSAMAVDRMDAVFVERPYRADDFGLVMRSLWAEAYRNPILVAHGEGSTASVTAKKKAKAPTANVALDDANESEALELNDAVTPGSAPTACGRVAAGKPGDVEYLVLSAPPVERWGERVCVFLVNTTGEKAVISVSAGKKGGDVTRGWRRRLVPDGKKGAMVSSVRERFGDLLSETVEPGEVTFFDFRF